MTKKINRLDPLDLINMVFSSSLCCAWEMSLLSFAALADPLRAFLIWSHTSFFMMLAFLFPVFLSSKLSWGCIRALDIWWMKSSVSLQAHMETSNWENQLKENQHTRLPEITLINHSLLWTCSWAIVQILLTIAFLTKLDMYFRDVTWHCSRVVRLTQVSKMTVDTAGSEDCSFCSVVQSKHTLNIQPNVMTSNLSVFLLIFSWRSKEDKLPYICRDFCKHCQAT